MPTSKPRITLTLTERQHELLSALSALQGVSMSSIVVDLLATTEPVLERLTSVLRNAASAPQAFLDQLKASIEFAESDLMNIQAMTVEALDALVSESAVPDVRPAQRGARLGQPPTSNRGVRIPPPTSKNASISPMKKGEKNGRAEK